MSRKAVSCAPLRFASATALQGASRAGTVGGTLRGLLVPGGRKKRSMQVELDALIVDEASMIDLELMTTLLLALRGIPKLGDADGMAARSAWRLLEEEGVVVMPGESFGLGAAAGHVRVALTVDKDVLREACGRIRRLIERLAG